MSVYLDHAASTPLNERAKQVMFAAFEQHFANPSAAHKLGRELTKLLEAERECFKQMIGGESGQLYFVSSATEANNWVIQKQARHGVVVYSPADHASITEVAKAMPTPMPMPSSFLSSRDLQNLKTETQLVCLTWVNGQSGSILPIVDLVRDIRSLVPKAHIHLDASQGLGKLSLSLSEMGVDSAAFSAHKLGGPKGIGALWVKAGVKLGPMLWGGGQEAGMRASTQAAPLILGFVEALRVALDMHTVHWERLLKLNQKLRSELQSIYPAVQFPFSSEYTSPYILCFLVPGLPSDILLRHLEQKAIYLASSSACSSKIKGLNPVFSALGIPDSLHKNVLRLSMGAETNASEIDQFLENFRAVMQDLSYLL